MYAQRIREIREKRGLSVKDAALLVDMHPTNISQIEHNKRNVTVSTLERLANAYGVKIGDFFSIEAKEIR